MSIICTQDGNWIAFVPGVGTVTGTSRAECMREIARLKAAQKGKAA
jgi:hypothetical protein